MSEVIRLMVVDDHPVVRKGLTAMLETEPDLTVIAECSNGQEAVSAAEELRPDVVLMDLVMPEMDGIEATRQIKERLPQVHVLVLTSFSTSDKVFPTLQAGAAGYLLKDSAPAELIRAIHQVYHGEPFLHPAVTRKVLAQMSHPEAKKHEPEEDLTERELEVLRYLARGHSNQEIARMLVVSEATVHSHVSKILAKLRVSSRTQAALWALRKGLVSLDPGGDEEDWFNG